MWVKLSINLLERLPTIETLGLSTIIGNSVEVRKVTFPG